MCIRDRADSLVSEVIDAGHDSLADSRKDGACQIIGVCRRTYLVEYNSCLLYTSKPPIPIPIVVQFRNASLVIVAPTLNPKKMVAAFMIL